MEKELTFNNHKFEKAVRESLRIKEAPITTTLAKNTEFLCLLNCEISDSDFDTLYQFENLEGLIIGETSGTFDLCRLTSFKKLEYLSIHGGEYSVMDILNVSALQTKVHFFHIISSSFIPLPPDTFASLRNFL